MIESKMQLQPRSVLAIENLKITPFSRMFGCSELEQVAKKVVTWLAENGNRWDASLPDLSKFGSQWDLSHSHPDGTACSFREFMGPDRAVNDDFIRMVTHHGDGNELSLESIRRLVSLEEDGKAV